jgi:hypothetical protein
LTLPCGRLERSEPPLGQAPIAEQQHRLSVAKENRIGKDNDAQEEAKVASKQRNKGS